VLALGVWAGRRVPYNGPVQFNAGGYCKSANFKGKKDAKWERVEGLEGRWGGGGGGEGVVVQEARNPMHKMAIHLLMTGKIGIGTVGGG
jgi:hypothetical protein